MSILGDTSILIGKRWGTALICLCLLEVLIPGRALPAAIGTGRSLAQAGHRVVAELERGQFAAFGEDVSADGLLFVRREPNWDQSNVPMKDPRPSFWPGGRTHSLSFRGMSGVAWEEHEVHFPKPDLANPNYRSLLRQFRGLVLESQDNYHTLTPSPVTEDGSWFYERRLGPAIFGKIASDECLFIYLKPEGGRWKVWRMECRERGAFQRKPQG